MSWPIAAPDKLLNDNNNNNNNSNSNILVVAVFDHLQRAADGPMGEAGLLVLELIQCQGTWP